MKSLKNNRIMQLIVVSAVIFMVNTFAMRMSEAGKKAAQSYMQKAQPQLEQIKAAQQELQQKRESMRKAGMYLIHGNDTDKGIMVDEKVVNMCKSLTAMIADVGGDINEISLDYPVAILKLGFGVLSDDVAIYDLSEKELVNVANFFNFLDVSSDEMNVVLMEIKEKIIDKNIETIVTNEMMKQLHPDLQKLLLTDLAIGYLKDIIATKWEKDNSGWAFVSKPGGGMKPELVIPIFPGLTHQKETLLDQIKNYTADQVRLICQLYIQSLDNQKITLKKGSEEEAIFKKLPQDMQNLLNDLFSLKGWFSGWW